MSEHSTDGPGHDPGEPPGDARALAVSAYADGEASDHEVRWVESDAEMLAEARRLVRLKQRVGDVPPLEPTVRDRLLAAALAELHSPEPAPGGMPGAATMSSRPSGTPASLAPPAPPPPARRGGGRWLAVAAAVVGVSAAAGLVVTLVDGGSDDAADQIGPVSSSAGTDDSEATPALGTGDATYDRTSDEDIAAADTSSAAAATAVHEPAPGSLNLLPAEEDSRSGRGSAGAEISDDTDLANWVLDVQGGRIIPARAGESACGTTILGSARSDGSEIIVAIEGADAVARDSESCDIVLSTDAP